MRVGGWAIDTYTTADRGVTVVGDIAPPATDYRVRLVGVIVLASADRRRHPLVATRLTPRPPQRTEV